MSMLSGGLDGIAHNVAPRSDIPRSPNAPRARYLTNMVCGCAVSGWPVEVAPRSRARAMVPSQASIHSTLYIVAGKAVAESHGSMPRGFALDGVSFAPANYLVIQQQELAASFFFLGVFFLVVIGRPFRNSSESTVSLELRNMSHFQGQKATRKCRV